MPTAYISFCRPINFDTATNLVKACRETLCDWADKDKTKKNNWDKLRLMISSGGGNVISAFGAYNELKRDANRNSHAQYRSYGFICADGIHGREEEICHSEIGIPIPPDGMDIFGEG